eukprot:15165687-Ditylum_brightwellii.AAC.1
MQLGSLIDVQAVSPRQLQQNSQAHIDLLHALAEGAGFLVFITGAASFVFDIVSSLGAVVLGVNLGFTAVFAGAGVAGSGIGIVSGLGATKKGLAMTSVKISCFATVEWKVIVWMERFASCTFQAG